VPLPEKLEADPTPTPPPSLAVDWGSVPDWLNLGIALLALAISAFGVGWVYYFFRYLRVLLGAGTIERFDFIADKREVAREAIEATRRVENWRIRHILTLNPFVLRTVTPQILSWAVAHSAFEAAIWTAGVPGRILERLRILIEVLRGRT
jgi:hypothetical protein